MAKKVKGIARVQITIELYAGPWGDDCTLAQMYKQAAEDALVQVQRLQTNRPPGGAVHFKILGEPKVVGVLTEED